LGAHARAYASGDAGGGGQAAGYDRKFVKRSGKDVGTNYTKIEEEVSFLAPRPPVGVCEVWPWAPAA
jgi:hypothetical protein